MQVEQSGHAERQQGGYHQDGESEQIDEHVQPPENA